MSTNVLLIQQPVTGKEDLGDLTQPKQALARFYQAINGHQHQWGPQAPRSTAADHRWSRRGRLLLNDRLDFPNRKVEQRIHQTARTQRPALGPHSVGAAALSYQTRRPFLTPSRKSARWRGGEAAPLARCRRCALHRRPAPRRNAPPRNRRSCAPSLRRAAGADKGR
jgi:hypothetical protein